jgi:signal transduction histidine kinase
VHGAPLSNRAGERLGAAGRPARCQPPGGWSDRTWISSPTSHELKTPLTTITGYAELLLDGALENPATAARFLETIRRQAERLRQIIEDLVVLARLDQEGGGEGIDHEPANLADILADAVTSVRGGAEQADVSIDLECPETLRRGPACCRSRRRL